MDNAVDPLIENHAVSVELIRGCVPEMEEKNCKLFTCLFKNK